MILSTTLHNKINVFSFVIFRNENVAIIDDLDLQS